jgi:hypothetical protein
MSYPICDLSNTPCDDSDKLCYDTASWPQNACPANAPTGTTVCPPPDRHPGNECAANSNSCRCLYPPVGGVNYEVWRESKYPGTGPGTEHADGPVGCPSVYPEDDCEITMFDYDEDMYNREGYWYIDASHSERRLTYQEYSNDFPNRPPRNPAHQPAPQPALPTCTGFQCPDNPATGYLDDNPGSITCAQDPCTRTECCTIERVPYDTNAWIGPFMLAILIAVLVCLAIVTISNIKDGVWLGWATGRPDLTAPASEAP